jgi:hypothetical protein
LKCKKGQAEAVRTPFTQPCENFKFLSEVTANGQSANVGEDYQIAFTGSPSSKFTQKHWFFEKTFVAPCPGWYSAELQVTGLNAPKDSLKLVSAMRYSQPIAVFDTSDKPSPKVQVYLYQYEAFGLVLAASKEPRSIEKAKLVLKSQRSMRSAKGSARGASRHGPFSDNRRLIAAHRGRPAAFRSRQDRV